MSNQPPQHNTMTLAGLAAANSPWLTVRLQRLAEHAGVHLPMQVVEHAVVGTSRVLGEVLDAEGRPAQSIDEATDPVAALGRQQGKAHQAAGLALPASLKVQRLLRRAYDDLVRESWVERDTRARAHEDVERFFERCLVGLVGAWTGYAPAMPGGQPVSQSGGLPVEKSAPAADAETLRLLAKREDELRRALDAGHRLSKSLRESRARVAELEEEIAQAREAGDDPEGLRARLETVKAQAAESLAAMRDQFSQLKVQAAESFSAMKTQCAEAQARAQELARTKGEEERKELMQRVRELEEERQALGERLADMEMTLAAHGGAENARYEAQEDLERARSEADRARAKADEVRSELSRLQEKARDLRSLGDEETLAAQAEAEGLRADLFQLREDHANLASEAEAMRTRLAEAGSRLSDVHRAEELEVQARLEYADVELAQARVRIAELEEDASALSAKLERARETLREDEQAKQEVLAQAKSLRDERDALAARLKTAEARAEQLSGAQDAEERLKAAEAQNALLMEDIHSARAALEEARAVMAAEQSRAAGADRAELAERLNFAEEQAALLAGDLERARLDAAQAQETAAQVEAAARNQEAERQTLAARLAAAEDRVRQLSGSLARATAELETTRADALSARNDERVQAFESERADYLERLRLAEDRAERLAGELTRAADARTAAEALQREAERQSGTALARTAELLREAQSQAQRKVEEITASRELSARLLAAHLALTPDAVAAVEADGTFSAWNKRFAALFNLPDSLLAAGLEAAAPTLCAAFQQPEALKNRLREIMAGPHAPEDALSLTTARGETLVFRAANVRQDNRLAGRILNFRDVSLEHDMESLVREIESLTRYELGSSFNALVNLPQALLDDPGTTPAQAAKLAAVREAGQRIVGTVNMAVDIFRMERGLYAMRPGQSMDLAVVARRAAKDVLPLAQSRHVDLELFLDQSPLPQEAALPAPGDPVLAHALTVNLLRDCLEAAPGKSLVSLVLHQDYSGVSLSVSRRGALPTDVAQTYFDKPDGQDTDEGARRGRYAARLIAGSLGGTLGLSSSAQAGTSLTFSLPRR